MTYYDRLSVIHRESILVICLPSISGTSYRLRPNIMVIKPNHYHEAFPLIVFEIRKPNMNHNLLVIKPI